ncbi:MAG: molybdopterin binding aldehyde oxidase and xanthine dehydrogenase, partial [Spirochaetes bacterium]
LTNSMNAYPIPSRRDVGEILVEFADSYEPTGPFGAKSIGEIGVDTPPAAIANALRAALGIRISDTPFTPEKVLKAIRSAKEAAQPKEHM